MNKLEIERGILASFLYLVNKSLGHKLDNIEIMKLLNIMEQCRRLIAEKDRKEEVKEIGQHFKQLEIF